MANPPLLKTLHGHFSSGPCAKIPGWSLDLLKKATLGRSHRSPESLEKLSQVMELTRDILEIPEDYYVALIPGSATGAVETSLWNLLGPKPTTVFSHDVFSRRWEQDITKHLSIKDVDLRTVPHGELPNCDGISPHNDILLNWNGSTSGVRFPHADFISEGRTGIVIADITSAAFTTEIPWGKLDAIAFSWQKGLGGEAAHGMLVLSPKAVERLNTYEPPWPLPYLFKLRERGNFYKPLTQGATLNTPSLLCIEDFLQALQWAKKQGGLTSLIKRSQQNFTLIDAWVSKTSWIDFLAQDASCRSTSTMVLVITSPQVTSLTEQKHRAFLQDMTSLLKEHGIAYDINNHEGAPPSLRLWGGPTIEAQDIAALLPWLEWAYEKTRADFFKT